MGHEAFVLLRRDESPQRHKGTKRNLCKTRSQRNQAHIVRRSAIFFADFHTLPRARAAAPAHTRAYASVPARLRAPPQGAAVRVPGPCGECLDSSNAAISVHKIWRARPYLYRAIRARRMDSMGRSTSHFSRIEVMTKTPEMRERSVYIENGYLQTVTF